MTFCNINRLLADIFCLVTDGLGDLDTIAKILGRRISELKKERSKNKGDEQL